MPDTSTILSLPLILPAQAQKHVTHNEALRLLDIIVQLAVIDRTLANPPVPAAGARYIVPAAATGAWAGNTGKIAIYEDGVWQFVTALAGWQAWVADEAAVAVFNGTTWVTQADAPLVVGQLGISATADATNRLAVSSPATLLNNAGAGHQVKVNKAAATDTASLLFQSGFSGRAEMGVIGHDDFGIKVSPDGTSFFTAMSVARADGQITLPAALRLGGQAVDPVSPADGMVWLNTTTSQVKVRSNGVSVVIATAAGGIADGDKGDVTVSGSGAVWTLDAGVVGNAKLASVAPATFKGRVTAGSGAPEDLTAAQATALLDQVTFGAKGLAPASGGGTANFLRADGTWAAPPAASAPAWGTVTGLLASQVDLAAALAGKASSAQGALADTALQPGAQIPWTDVTAKPATFAPSAHAHLIADTTGLQTTLDAKQPLTTVLSNTTASYVLADQAKLAGIAAGATTNATDVALRDRTSHTGTQTAATISDLSAAVAGNAAVVANTAKVTNASHTGDATGSTVLTLATVNANVGTFGSAAQVATVTLNAKGLATAAGNVAIAIAATQIADSTSAGRSVLTAADATAQRAALGLGSLATQSGTFSGTSSGANTGDQTTIVGIAGTKAQFNTALLDGDIQFVGDAPTAHGHTLADLSQSAATLGQVAQWNGSAWVAATVAGGGGVSDGDKGDVIVSGGGTVWTLNPAVAFGLSTALQQQIFFN